MDAPPGRARRSRAREYRQPDLLVFIDISRRPLDDDPADSLVMRRRGQYPAPAGGFYAGALFDHDDVDAARCHDGLRAQVAPRATCRFTGGKLDRLHAAGDRGRG